MILAQWCGALESLVLEHGQTAVVEKHFGDASAIEVFRIAFNSVAAKIDDTRYAATRSLTRRLQGA